MGNGKARQMLTSRDRQQGRPRIAQPVDGRVPVQEPHRGEETVEHAERVSIRTQIIPATTGANSQGTISRPRKRLRSRRAIRACEQEREAEPDHEVSDHAAHREEEGLPERLPEGGLWRGRV